MLFGDYYEYLWAKIGQDLSPWLILKINQANLGHLVPQIYNMCPIPDDPYAVVKDVMRSKPLGVQLAAV